MRARSPSDSPLVLSSPSGFSLSVPSEPPSSASARWRVHPGADETPVSFAINVNGKKEEAAAKKKGPSETPLLLPSDHSGRDVTGQSGRRIPTREGQASNQPGNETDKRTREQEQTRAAQIRRDQETALTAEKMRQEQEQSKQSSEAKRKQEEAKRKEEEEAKRKQELEKAKAEQRRQAAETSKRNLDATLQEARSALQAATSALGQVSVSRAEEAANRARQAANDALVAAHRDTGSGSNSYINDRVKQVADIAKQTEDTLQQTKDAKKKAEHAEADQAKREAQEAHRRALSAWSNDMNKMSLQDQEKFLKALDSGIALAREKMGRMGTVKGTDPTATSIISDALDSAAKSIKSMEMRRTAVLEAHRRDTSNIDKLQDLAKKAEEASASALDQANKADSPDSIKTARASVKKAKELHEQATSVYKERTPNQQKELKELERRIDESKAKAERAEKTAAELENACYVMERAYAAIQDAMNATEGAYNQKDPTTAQKNAVRARESVDMATTNTKSLEGSTHAYIIKIVSAIDKEVAKATAKIDALETQARQKEERQKEERQKEALGDAKKHLIEIDRKVDEAEKRVKPALQDDNDLDAAIKAQVEVRSEGASLLINQETAKVEKAKAAAAEERDQVKVLKDGLSYILENTRRCAYDASSVTDDQDVRSALGTYKDTLSVLDSSDTAVPDLANDQTAVGAVLFDGQDYAGVALPVVVREVHETKVILVRERYTRHVMITASERQAAVSLGYTHAYRAAPSTGAEVNPEKLTERFLEHMFLDDMCVLDGSTPSRAAENFQVCINNIGVESLKAIRLLVPKPDQTIVDETFGREKNEVEEFYDYIQSVLSKYIENANQVDGNRDSVTLMPIGYYDEREKKGHQAAILVVEQGEDALVAISDTGETAMGAAYADHRGAYRPKYKGLASIVVIGKAKRKTARGILEFAKDVVISDSTELQYIRKAVLLKCNVGYYNPYTGFDLWYSEPNRDMVVRDDRHLAVQVLLTADNRILSHTQRGGTCTFYSILWLLGIAYALSENARAVDHVIPTTATPNAAKTKGVALAAALIDSIGAIDKKIKTFALSQLYRHRRVAELVAADYAGCSWLDTKALRDRLVGIENTEVAPTFVAKCKIERKQLRALSYDGDPCKSLKELSEWIDDHGMCPMNEDAIFMRYAISAAFVHRARGLLIKPMRYTALASDATYILRISTYISHVREWSIVTMDDTMKGMAMRCVRLIIAIVNKLRGKRRDDGRVIMPATFSTSLPWVAAEYYELQAESEDVAGFMFDKENMARMSTDWNKEKKEQTTGMIGTRILSTNTFHKGWIDGKKGVIETEKKNLEDKYLSRLSYDDISARIQKYEKQITDTEALVLEGIQVDALEYIRHNEDLAVLNVASALLLHENNCVKSHEHTHFVFGYNDGVLFCASRHAELQFKHNLDGYENNHKDINSGVSLTTRPQYSASEAESHAEMAQNMAYLHDATRDCAAKEPRNHEAENADLQLNLRYPPEQVNWDIGSLVAWVDSANGSCVYDGRSVEYVLRRHVMPISAHGPTDAAVLLLKGKVGKLASDTSTPAASPGCKSVLVETEDLLGGTVTLPLKIHKERDWKVALLAFMTIAAHERKTNDVMGLLGIATSTTTDPPSFWSLTPITANATFVQTSVPNSDKELFELHFSEYDKRRFVFDADGDGMAKVHRRLLGAGVRFDHWMSDENKSTIQTRDAVIENADGKISVRMGAQTYGIFTRHCEWWDSTYKAAVLPIGPKDGKVEKLVVFPGEIEYPRPKSRYPSRVLKKDDEAPLRAYLASLPKRAFVVDLDTVGVIPAATTGDGKVQDTDKLVLLFVAYAYAGSRLGTRLMPCVASRAIIDEREIVVYGSKSVVAHEAMRLAILHSSCPLGEYSALALIRASHRDLDEIASALRCKNEDIRHRLVARLRSSSVYDHTDPATRARFSFWAEYGEPERIQCHEEAMKKAESDRDDDKTQELARLKAHTDEWMTVLSATTGRFVRADQREMIGLITSDPETWRVVQMGMGFGKSSVIVPMLVARYLSMKDVHIVFVTQPPHLVPQAARTVGALIAAHPFVGHNKELKPVYAISVSDLRAIVTSIVEDAWTTIWDEMLHKRMNYKLVVILSTADMQSLVRDMPRIYAQNANIAHIADELDSESDPMRCEVIIAGTDMAGHYDEKVAKNITTYYAAACELGFGMDASANITKLDEMSESDVKAGTRLQNVFASVRRNMDHRVHYGMSDDDSKILAVPFEYAGTPSRKRLFSDIDVETVVAVDSIKKGMRPSDWDRLFSYIRKKFRRHAGRVLEVLGKDLNQELAQRYYLTEYALHSVQMSKSEIAVSFVDLLGTSRRFVGFSGTMGTSIEAPTFDKLDGNRKWCSEKKAGVTADDKSNDLVKHIIQNAKCLVVGPADPGVKRATAVIRKIQESMQTAEYDRLHVVIVDGSGEFGAFEDDLGEIKKTLGRNVEYFGNDGVLVRDETEEGQRIARYYSHRNSRGVDSVMPVDTVGYTVMSEKKSRYSDISQAVFRLRALKREGPSQRVVLVVVKDSASSHDGEYNGSSVLNLLVTNEQNYGKSAAITKEKQKEHARKVKHNEKDFKRAVVYTKVEPDDAAPTGTAQKQQTHVSEAQKQQERETQVSQERTITRGEHEACYERLKGQAREDKSLTLANHFTQTTLEELKDNLAAINIGLSPMIMIKELTKGVTEIRRAFAVNESEVVVLTVVEAWAKYAQSEGAYSYYTYDGALITSSMKIDKMCTINPGLILFGRFLCDDALSIDEEAVLLAYLAEKYRGDYTRALTAVIKCLRDSKFLSYPHVMLQGLLTKAARDIIRENRAKDLAETVSSGSPILYKLFLPIIEKALRASSFGRATRRTISRFI